MKGYIVKDISCASIFNDIEFNCRGSILPMDVVDLAKDIDKNGLQFPITVQPVVDVTTEVAENFEYRIIAGHRRFTAFKVLQKETIPAMIRPGLSEIQARLLNLTENLVRKELNVKQEAEAVRRLRLHGLTQEAMAERLGRSRTWVQVRMDLLRLPEEIQEEAAAGLLNQHQIRQIFSLKIPEKQFEAVRKIKNARDRGEKGVDVGKKPQDDPLKAKRRSVPAVQEMIEHLGNNVGYGLHTRTLAWANGQINTAELYADVAKFAQDNDREYTIPLAGVTV